MLACLYIFLSFIIAAPIASFIHWLIYDSSLIARGAENDYLSRVDAELDGIYYE